MTVSPTLPTALPPAPPPPRRGATLALLGVVLLVALIETRAALWPQALSEADLRAACAAVRAEFHPGDLIVLAPPWLSPLGQRELGDLMPVTMLGRADARRYARIWTIQFGHAGAGELTADLAGLSAGFRREFGQVTLLRYAQKPVTVTYDLTAQLLAAQVAQAAVGGAPAVASPELPCLWSGPVPTPHPQHGPAGAFRCPSSTVERRVMEIDYRPRYGVVATLAQGQRTVLSYSGIPDADWQGGRLALWLGLHDYHARKTAVGPAQVVVDLDHGAQRMPLTVEVAQGFVLHELPLPLAKLPTHTIRIELWAASAANHFVGLHGELRR